MALDEKNGFVYTCDVDSRVVRTECKSGETEDFIGNPHKDTQLKMIRLTTDCSAIYTIGVDDQMVRSDVEKLTFAEKGAKLGGSARCFVVGNVDSNLAIVGHHKNELQIFKGIELECFIRIF